MRKLKTPATAFALAALFFSAVTASAQTGYGIRGHVLRERADGSRVAAADVLIDIYCADSSSSYDRRTVGRRAAVAAFQRQPSRCQQSTARTDEEGRFSVALPYYSGEYIIAASAAWAAPSVLARVRAGARIDYELILKPGDGSRLSKDEARDIAEGRRPQPGAEAAGEGERENKSGVGAITGATNGGGNGGEVARAGDETGSYVLAEKNETVVVEASGGRGNTPVDRALRMRLANNETAPLQKVGEHRYRFLWHGDADYVTFRADSENPGETEMYMETPRGNYVLKRPKPSKPATPDAAAGRPAARDTDPPQIVITSPPVERGVKLSVQSGKVTVAGRATDESGVNEVLVQGTPARLDEQGNFSADVLLKVGENRVTVEAVDIHGNRGATDFTLRRESQPFAAAPEAVEQPAPSGGLAPLAPGRYYALVIGINDYKFLPHLKTAESDARSVAAVLRERLGFDVDLLLNATRQQIVGALNRYRRELDPSANLVIYYAGHGYFDKQVEKAYWLPVDAALDDNANWISADDVTVNVKGIPARHVLIISDSCYSGTIVRGINPDLSKPSEREQYIRRMLSLTSRTLIASGGNEPVADGGAGGHSVFASALLRGLDQTDRDAFTAEELFYKYIREAVSGRSDQTPEYNALHNSGHDGGDFVFVRKKQ
jgi:Caspase domain/Glucodextranase, domain B